MNIDDKLETARKLVAEHEGREGQTWAIVRGLLGEIEEELRVLRTEKERREVRYLTRREFAAALRISTSTLDRAIAAKKIKPAVPLGSGGRFSSLQLEFADEIFSGKRDATGRLKTAGARQTAEGRAWKADAQLTTATTQ